MTEQTKYPNTLYVAIDASNEYMESLRDLESSDDICDGDIILVYELKRVTKLKKGVILEDVKSETKKKTGAK